MIYSFEPGTSRCRTSLYSNFICSNIFVCFDNRPCRRFKWFYSFGSGGHCYKPNFLKQLVYTISDILIVHCWVNFRHFRKLFFCTGTKIPCISSPRRHLASTCTVHTVTSQPYAKQLGSVSIERISAFAVYHMLYVVASQGG